MFNVFQWQIRPAQSRPVMITISAHVVCAFIHPSVCPSSVRTFQNFAKQNKFQLIASGGTVSLAEWIIDCTHILFYLFLGTSCGYASCHLTKPDMLNVHLISHSHDDVGWLKTVDQYFVGSKRTGWEYDNQKVGVADVLDSVTRSLTQNPNRK